MLHSALANTAEETISVHLLHMAPLDVQDVEYLHRVVGAFRGRLDVIHIEPAEVDDLAEGYFPRSVWLRILLPEVLAVSDRVVYLDADVIVTDSLMPLWRSPLGTDLLGAVSNPLYPYMPPYPRDQLGIDDPADYFNSGVLLMNLDQMRRERTGEALRNYAIENPGNWYPDQDALNAVCRGRWRRLHPRWNVQSTIYELPPSALPFSDEEVCEARHHPAVVHFIGPFKPWQYLCRHPLQRLYTEHAAATPWGAPNLEGRTLKNAVLRRLPIAWIDRWMTAERNALSRWHRVKGRVGRMVRTG